MRRNAALALVAVVAAVGVVTAGVVAAGVVATDATGSHRNASSVVPLHAAQNGTSIDVSATGSATANPDVAVLSVAVVSTADSADAARAAVAQNVSSLRDSLAAAGVAKDDIVTTTYRVNERVEKHSVPVTAGGSTSGSRTSGGSVSAGSSSTGSTVGTHVEVKHTYEAVHGFEVTIRDPSRAGDVLDAAVSGGANRVNGVRFTLSDAKRTALRQRAIHAAMADAHSQATAVANASNLTITSLDSVSVGATPGPIAYASSASGGSTTAPKTVIDHGPVTVTASVHATYTAN